MVAKTLGHANVAVTLNRYSHLLLKHMKASMDKLKANFIKSEKEVVTKLKSLQPFFDETIARKKCR